MASNYPGSLDSFDTIASDKKTSDSVGGRTHRDMHNDLGDAIESVQAELGTDPAGGSATVKARFDVIEANDWVTAARIAADAVGTSEIAANAVGSSELADNAVTSAKIAAGTIVSSDVAASTFVDFATVGNLLTANQASVETDTTGWLAAADCIITQNTGAGGTHGVACLEATATSTADPVWWTTWITGINAGDVYTAVMDIAASPNAAAIDFYIEWSDGASQLALTHAPAATAISASFTTMEAVGVAPATTTRARLVVIAANTAGGDKFFCDRFGLWKGAGGVWAMPGTPITGLSSQASNNAVHLSGTGVPESVITAAPGSTWLQTDSTTDVKGWIRWVKATGTGNTGWQVDAEYDSGSRDLAAVSMSNSWAVSGSLFKLQRVGRTVSIDAAFTKASASADAAYTLPAGFRPQQATVRRIANTDTADDFVTVSITSAGVISIVRSSMSSDIVYLSLSFLCAAAAPSSLPGS